MKCSWKGSGDILFPSFRGGFEFGFVALLLFGCTCVSCILLAGGLEVL